LREGPGREESGADKEKERKSVFLSKYGFHMPSRIAVRTGVIIAVAVEIAYRVWALGKSTDMPERAIRSGWRIRETDIEQSRSIRLLVQAAGVIE
jgi:hypothetical protein